PHGPADRVPVSVHPEVLRIRRDARLREGLSCATLPISITRRHGDVLHSGGTMRKSTKTLAVGAVAALAISLSACSGDADGASDGGDATIGEDQSVGAMEDF